MADPAHNADTGDPAHPAPPPADATGARVAGAAASLAEMLDERRQLLAVAASAVGSPALADWVVQETYRSWYALADDERAAVAVPLAWLSQVARRISHAAPPVPPYTQSVLPSIPASVGHTRLRWALDRHTRVVRRFAAACASEDPLALRALLDADALVIVDGGGKVRAPLHPIHGAARVAPFLATLLFNLPDADFAAEPINGQAGVVLRQSSQAVATIALAVTHAKATTIWLVLNPHKLHTHHLQPRPPSQPSW